MEICLYCIKCLIFQNDKRKAAEFDEEKFEEPDLSYLGGQEAYNYIIEKLKDKDPSPEQLFDEFIKERSLNVGSF